MDPLISEFTDRIRKAAADKRALRIRGSGSKDFYAYRLEGEPLEISAYRGVVDYEPSELVMTARAGTPLSEIEETLARGGQMLACEPPYFGPQATLGGCVASGFSGPRRAYAGSVRDFVLGTRVLNGKGEDLRFGGQVMKNVAGFDVSRLMTGSFGTLAAILEASLKVLPRPDEELTLRFEMSQAEAITTMNRWAGLPLPVSGTCHVDGALLVRLSGSELGVGAARAKLGGDIVPDAPAVWRSIREHTLEALRGPLWRLSIKPTMPPLDLPGRQTLEWNGSLRWISTDVPDEQVHAAARRGGGHATRFRGGNGAPIMHLDPAVLELHKRIKVELDPAGIFGPRRLHPEF